jgi:MinD-like ATPase involved in chromosome partitioning or flagellar assembly
MSRIRSALATVPTAVFSSTAARVRELEAADRVIRAPLALSHRIAFTQLGGGTGASAVAAYIAGILAHRRTGPVLGVNASGGLRTLLWHAGLTNDQADERESHGGPTTHRLSVGNQIGRVPDARRLRPSSFADASASLDRSAGGLYALDVRPVGADIAATEADWATPVAPIARFYDVVCTDWGVRRPELDLGGVAAGSHTVCLVARADRSSLEEAVAVTAALRGLANHPHVVVAAVDLGKTAGRAPEAVRWGEGSVIVRIPFDPARSEAGPVASEQLSTRSRMAHTLLAAELMPPLRGSAPVPEALHEVSTSETSPPEAVTAGVLA